MTTVKRNVDCNMIIRLFASGPSIIRREYRADEGDHDNGVITAIAYPVYIPPKVATWRNIYVEAWSLARQSAASFPESAAIGTPGPG